MKKQLRRTISMGLCLCMMLCLFAMPAYDVQAQESVKELSVTLGADPMTLDPAWCIDTSDSTMISTAFEGLFMNGEDDQVIGGCADSWSVSEDGLTWMFYLREGLTWSDGSPLTASDFEYSWKRICDPDTAAPYAATVLWMVEGFEEAMEGNLDALAVTAVDDLTLEVNLSTPCSYFTQLAAFPALYPVQQKTVEKNGEDWALSAETYVTNGAFYIAEWEPGSHLTMAKNENYWNAEAVNLDRITFHFIEDSKEAYEVYLNGGLQFTRNIPTDEISNLIGQEDFYTEPIIGTYYLSFNTEAELLQDANVRKALTLAIDREYVSDTIMQGTYEAAYNLVGPGWLDTDGSQFIDNANGGEPYISADYEANVAEAKQLLKDAGYEDGLELTYKTNDASFHVALAEYLQEAWAEIGVTLTIETLDWGTFLEDRYAGDFEIARNGWVGDYLDPSGILELFYSENGNNDSNFADPKLDTALELAGTTTDLNERSEALHTVEDILMENVVCCPIAYYTDYWLESNDVVGISHSALGTWILRFADVVGEGAEENPFADVIEDEYYYDAVMWAVENGITVGTGIGKFSPDDVCTRAHVVTFLWRANGCPTPDSTENPFTDVKKTDYFYEAVLWAVENGITLGMTKTTFDPDKTCKRAQVVTFLHRANGEEEPVTTENPFTDVEATSYYNKAVLWAVENGITSGMSETTFGPDKDCTRAHVVTFLNRAESLKRAVAEEFDFALIENEERWIEGLAFNEDVTVSGDNGTIIFFDCEFNGDIINTSKEGTAVMILESEVKGKCIFNNNKKEATIEDVFPKFLVDAPVEFVCEDCVGVVIAAGDFEIVFNGKTQTMADSELFLDLTDPNAELVAYEGQEATYFVVGQWWEAGEKVMFLECEYDPGE